MSYGYGVLDTIGRFHVLHDSTGAWFWTMILMILEMVLELYELFMVLVSQIRLGNYLIYCILNDLFVLFVKSLERMKTPLWK